MNTSDQQHHSIGEVAMQTGISVDTIRIWERRYGKPVPIRLPSGHRRYTREDLRWLRRVAEALARGVRAGVAVRASEEELDRLIGVSTEEVQADPRLAELLELARGLRAEQLERQLAADWQRLGPVPFLSGLLAPFLDLVGRAWVDGEIDVRHERLASEVVENLLRRLRSQFEVPERGPLVLLATLSGERHSLGLRMVALACAARGVRNQVFGTEMSPEQIALAARDLEATAIVVSVSLATGGVETDRRLTELRDSLPEDIRLIVGGRGARGIRRGLRGVEYLGGFDELEDRLRELRQLPRA